MGSSPGKTNVMARAGGGGAGRRRRTTIDVFAAGPRPRPAGRPELPLRAADAGRRADDGADGRARRRAGGARADAGRRRAARSPSRSATARRSTRCTPRCARSARASAAASAASAWRSRRRCSSGCARWSERPTSEIEEAAPRRAPAVGQDRVGARGRGRERRPGGALHRRHPRRWRSGAWAAGSCPPPRRPPRRCGCWRAAQIDGARGAAARALRAPGRPLPGARAAELCLHRRGRGGVTA